MRMQPRAAGIGATRIVHQGFEPRRGINQPGQILIQPAKSSQAVAQKGLTSARPCGREFPRHIQFWSLHGKKKVDDDHDDNGDDDGKVGDIGAEDSGQEALALEAFEGGGNEVGPDEEQAAHEKYIGQVAAT